MVMWNSIFCDMVAFQIRWLVANGMHGAPVVIERQQGHNAIWKGLLLFNAQHDHIIKDPIFRRLFISHNNYIPVRRTRQQFYCFCWIVNCCDHLYGRQHICFSEFLLALNRHSNQGRPKKYAKVKEIPLVRFSENACYSFTKTHCAILMWSMVIEGRAHHPIRVLPVIVHSLKLGIRQQACRKSLKLIGCGKRTLNEH